MRRIALAIVVGITLNLTSAPARTRPANAQVHARSSSTRPAGRPATRPRSRPAEARPTLASARKLYWTGRYAQAASAYEKLLDSPAQALPASIGLAEARAAVGQYDQALAALRRTATRARHSAEWHLMNSRLQETLGRYVQALESAREALRLRPDWAPAMLRVGTMLETLGKKDQAIRTYKSLDKAVARPDFRRDARSLVAAGKILDRYAVLTGQKASKQAQNILHNYFQRAYQKVDPTYWPANVAAGMFLLSKRKMREAAIEFKLAEKINKRIPQVFVARGSMALRRYRFEVADAQARKALSINPRYDRALLLQAATRMRWRKFPQVAPVLEKILAVNPHHLEALSMMAALHVCTLHPDQAAPYVQRVRKINPDYAGLYETIADWLSAERQFDEAEKYYLRAMRLAPELVGPVANLGLVYMQTGREDQARQVLKKAFAIDDYRSDVMNYLNLLDRLEKFLVKETPHFIIKVSARDQVLLDWLAEQAEKVHAEVSADFNHSPSHKTLVELFPNQADFSVRITGRGWVPTVGACTGRVIAMPAPDPLRGGFGSFNWAVVLRHEYTHAVTLSATKNRIPTWFTEACAVWEQPDRRNFQAVRLLVGAVRTRRLFPISELSWGFVRRTRRGPRSLAYAQSEWIFEYIVEKKGFETILKMLAGFAKGWNQQRVFQEVLGTTEKQFDKDFAAWAVEQVRSWGFRTSPVPDLAQATRAVKVHPRSARAHANLALAWYARRRLTQAEAAARQALRLAPKQPRALAVLATILKIRKRYDEAVALARRLERVEPRSATAAKVRADCALARRNWPEAILALEDFKQRRPLDPYGYEKLAKLYMQLGQPEKALPNLIEMHRRTMRKPQYARQVADICRTAGKLQMARQFYEEVIHINPYDAGAYKALASLDLRLRRHKDAIRAMRSATLLEPDNAEVWAQLAMVYYRVARAGGSPECLSQARAAARKALRIDPDSRAAEVLRMIQSAGAP